MSQPLEELKYPIGQYDPTIEITDAQIKDWISVIEKFPEKLAAAIQDLTLGTHQNGPIDRMVGIIIN